MSRLVQIALFCCLSGCAVMHSVTGDAMFAPEPKPVAKGPNVPDAEPTEPPPEPLVEVHQSGPRLDDDELAPLPRSSSATTAAKKKSTNVAKR